MLESAAAQAAKLYKAQERAYIYDTHIGELKANVWDENEI